jgi:pyrroloquinoline quinone biosynthesis protein B
MKKLFWCLLILTICLSSKRLNAQQLFVLGTAQDAGYPHIGCNKICCKTAIAANRHENVVSIAVTDTVAKKWWLFEATPDITAQMRLFQKLTDSTYPFLPAGIFITHAHIGHYTGLMYLGREAMNAAEMPVYCMPRMAKFLKKNGPWSQLVELHNIQIHKMKREDTLRLSNGNFVIPMIVPHRGEYSETVGFKIVSGGKRILFVPDINKWQGWHKYGGHHHLYKEVQNADFVLIDGTFYKEGELPGRNMKEISHPYVEKTMEFLGVFNASVKKRIYFIHFNHTNPLLWDENTQQNLREKGFQFAQTGMEL